MGVIFLCLGILRTGCEAKLRIAVICVVFFFQCNRLAPNSLLWGRASLLFSLLALVYHVRVSISLCTSQSVLYLSEA